MTKQRKFGNQDKPNSLPEKEEERVIVGNRNNNYTVIENHTDQKVPLALGSH